MPEENAAPEKLIINGLEYDPAEVSSLIEIGNKTREFETKWNTSLDKVYPDYTRATQKASQAERLEKDLAERTQQLEELQRQTKVAETPQEKQDALKAARELGLTDREYLKEAGYMTKADVDSYFQTKQSEQAAVQQVLGEADRLEKEVDGSDGRVPFNKKAVLAYASAYNMSDLSLAYDEMNERLNAGWKAKQIEDARTPGLKTLKGGGKKAPPAPTQLNDGNVRDALREALWGSGEE